MQLCGYKLFFVTMARLATCLRLTQGYIGKGRVGLFGVGLFVGGVCFVPCCGLVNFKIFVGCGNKLTGYGPRSLSLASYVIGGTLVLTSCVTVGVGVIAYLQRGVDDFFGGYDVVTIERGTGILAILFVNVTWVGVFNGFTRLYF